MTYEYQERAKAKINLTLHVGSKINDISHSQYGYHPLNSLVVFSDIADEVLIVPSKENKISITGPFGYMLNANESNSTIQALKAIDRSPRHIKLLKNLPVSAGIGGGSANAAAVMRIFNSESIQVAMSLGADVPVCLFSKTAQMSGIGENLSFLPGLGQVNAVLVNPRVSVSTAKVFKAFDDMFVKGGSILPTTTEGSLLIRAINGRNDLEAAAISLEPIIGDVLSIINNQTGCCLARMSGSGPTCYGLFKDAGASLKAANAIRSIAPDWWCETTILGDK
ncbi:MAG: 4-(cytidine 5'-diphospho)-2-C-methyl-D-erythritol kinase [Hellea sp.]|nr:4-(cytidine 5'-diphospho)-2-C-methyl-D-erythritol kinase [Hellea sp.]